MKRAVKATIADMKGVLLLYGLMLTVVATASYLIYHEGARRLSASAESHQRQEAAIAKTATEGAIRSLIENMELWVRQPLMVELLDEDVDHEIADLLGTTLEKTESINEISCISPQGKVIVSTNPALVNERFDPPLEALIKVQGGLRAKIEQFERWVIIDVPIFWQFDERECLGVLRAKADADAFLTERLDWWMCLADASGRVLVQRGPSLPHEIDFSQRYADFPDYGRVIIKEVRLNFPRSIIGPEWHVVVMDTYDDLYGEIRILGNITIWMATGSAIAVVALVLGFSRRQRVLMLQLSDRSKALEKNAQALESANLALKEANIAAEAATVAKSEFLANMSHEIRTPMTAILGFAETLSENVIQPENKEAVATVIRNGNHLLTIINDILDLSKIEAGKMVVESLSCAPQQLVSEVVSLMRVRTLAKGLVLDVEYDGPIPERIQTDPVRVRQVLINLIGNAIKFTDTGGIRLITRLVRDRGDPQLAFDIVDTGIGMSESQVGKLFQPFNQADTSMARKFGGTGLGLVISKRFAEILGGDIVLVETREDAGSRFRVTIATGSLDGVKLVEPSEIVLPTASPGAKPSAPSLQTLDCNVLLAEDGPDNQRLIKHILKKAGATVTVVENGQLAVNEIVASMDTANGVLGFDVILMDMQMPVMDGYQATVEIRKKGWNEPIIALTAHAMSGDRDKCIKAGCDDYATKPINRKRLIEMIDRHLSAQGKPVAAG